jgi:hypothetical protein
MEFRTGTGGGGSGLAFMGGLPSKILFHIGEVRASLGTPKTGRLTR